MQTHNNQSTHVNANQLRSKIFRNLRNFSFVGLCSSRFFCITGSDTARASFAWIREVAHPFHLLPCFAKVMTANNSANQFAMENLRKHPLFCQPKEFPSHSQSTDVEVFNVQNVCDGVHKKVVGVLLLEAIPARAIRALGSSLIEKISTGLDALP